MAVSLGMCILQGRSEDGKVTIGVKMAVSLGMCASWIDWVRD